MKKGKIYPYRNLYLENGEKKFGLTLEQIQYIDWDSVWNRIDNIINLYSNYRLQDMLPDLYLIVKEFEHFDKVLNEINLEYCSRINKTFKHHNIDATISFDEIDIDQQFMPNEEKTKSEIFANIILLVDTLIEIFEEENTKKNLRKLVPGMIIDEDEDEVAARETNEIVGIIPFFENIRKECLKELIKIRQEIENGTEKDERLLIYKHKPYNLPQMHKGFYYIVIPEYLEPVITNCDDVDLYPDIQNQDFIEVGTLNENNNLLYHIFRFPIKITSEQEVLIEQYAELTLNRHFRNDRNCANVIKAYMHNQTLLDPFCNRHSLLRYKLEVLEQERQRLQDELKRPYLRKPKREDLQGKLNRNEQEYDKFI